MSLDDRDTPPVDLISPRQLELLLLLGSGMSLRQASEQMGIERKTANDHKCRLMYRLDLKSRDELKAYAGRIAASRSNGGTEPLSST